MKLISTICALIVVAALLWASGIAPVAYNTVQSSGFSLTQRPTLNFPGGGCVDNAANNSTDCSSSGGSSGGGVTVFSRDSITLSGTQFVSIGGGAAISGTEANVSIMSPVLGTVSGLSVQISTALGAGNSAVFTWRDAGASQTVTCTISGAAARTCTDVADSFSVKAGDELDIQIVTTGSPAAVTLVIATQFVGLLSNLSTTFTIQNDTGTGTTVSTLTKLTSAGRVVIAATTDTGGVVGITTAGAGKAGQATITTAGRIFCVFDGATTAGDYVQISSTTAGNCHDAGASYPTSNQVIGRTITTNVGAGTYLLDLFPAEIKASSGGGGAASSPTVKQWNSIRSNTTMTFYVASAASSVVVACVGWEGGMNSPSSLADSASTSYTKIAELTGQANENIAIYSGTLGATPGTLTFTATLPSGGNFGGIHAIEFTAGITATVDAQSISANGNSNTPISLTPVTANDVEVLCSQGSSSSGATTVHPPGIDYLTASGNDSGAIGYSFLFPPTNVVLGSLINNSGDDAYVAVAFKHP
jgi:hypothetical protein